MSKDAIDCRKVGLSSGQALAYNRASRSSVAALIAALVLITPAIAAAQPPPGFLSVRLLRPGIAVIHGPDDASGGNITVGYGPGDLVIVDDQMPDLTDQVIAQVKTLDARPIKLVINTHWHYDHAGGNEVLAKLGAQIIAHANVKPRLARGAVVMVGDQRNDLAPAPAIALPSRTYQTTMMLTASGDRLKLVHVPHAHTDGDTIVKWSRANVLNMGDVYVRYGLPFIDLDAGGSLRGMIACVDAGLALSNNDTIIVPGHGDPATRRELAAYRSMLARIADIVDTAVRAGKTLAQVQALRPADGIPQSVPAMTPDQFVALAYASAKLRRK